jgi:glycosyltransferase involved in cell wall biosynthesis
MLSAGWVRENRSRFDVFHVHFGFDACAPDDLRSLGDELREAGKPLVVTVHDLENPHHEDQELHRTQLGALLETASEVITLTPGAADEIAALYGRKATVVAHPHIVPFDRMPDVRRPGASDPGTARRVKVGLHLKSLRRNMDPGPVVEAAIAAADQCADAAPVRIDIHKDAYVGSGPNPDPALCGRLERLAAAGRIDLRVHDYFPQDEFFDYLESVDISVLPYAFGTHSGWLEACRDLGTTVVAPSCGYYSQQARTFSFRLADGRPHRGSVSAAVRSAIDTVLEHGRNPVGRRFRRRQRLAIGAAHRAIYRRAIARAGKAAHRSTASQLLLAAETA